MADIFSYENIPASAWYLDYQALVDKVIGDAARNRCGVRITVYSNGDITVQARNDVKFGTVEEKHVQAR